MKPKKSASHLPSGLEARFPQVADLRKEIEHIKELNDRFLLKKFPSARDKYANEERRIRLIEILRELAELSRVA